MDGLNFLRERGDVMSVNVMSEKIQLTGTEEALVGINDNSVRD